MSFEISETLLTASQSEKEKKKKEEEKFRKGSLFMKGAMPHLPDADEASHDDYREGRLSQSAPSVEDLLIEREENSLQGLEDDDSHLGEEEYDKGHTRAEDGLGDEFKDVEEGVNL